MNDIRNDIRNDIPNDYTVDDMMRVMFAEVDVYETRDPEKNRQRRA